MNFGADGAKTMRTIEKSIPHGARGAETSEPAKSSEFPLNFPLGTFIFPQNSCFDPKTQANNSLLVEERRRNLKLSWITRNIPLNFKIL